ncbi:uncharacterized protein LOC113227985 [Hyposmocoma kahamanoa]|uniref:uncharacterized protein LOC113227985 n=1 Tax=Hyposmocoma kahamanoa TaxID=1477025 RepID=UPI000E6D8A10|nr:uncharacterized protein LOC113227985 [Hyposmocoma kahamanoa]
MTMGGCCPGCAIGTDVGTDEDNVPVGECRPPANCLPDGRFAPVQCKGDRFTGRCFCSDERGNRIFGQMWRDEADEMTCACSRRRSQLEAEGRVDVSLHCTPNGSYEPLQCDDGLCWCAEPKTGQPTIIPVPEQDMNLLPCFRAAEVGEQYLRQCESLTIAFGMIHMEHKSHGTNFLGNPVTFCDYDGSYGPLQIQNGIAYCTGRDGKILGAWQTITSEMEGMNCNCAQDTMIHFPARGMSMTHVCQGNGNYRPHQNVGDISYCVDTDGYPNNLLPPNCVDPA